MHQRPELVAARLQDIVIEFGLRRASAVTDTHTISVEEPSMWADVWGEDPSKLKTETREIDL